MVEKKRAFETAGNHWYWRGRNPLDCQTATLITLPEAGRITRLEFKVGGLTGYNDPVYGYQSNKSGEAAAAIWNPQGVVLTKSAAKKLPPTTVSGSTSHAPWVSFPVTPLDVKAGQSMLVGFWRRSNSSSYATQWPYNSAASGYTTYSHNLSDSSSGPLPFRTSTTYSSRSLNFRVWYETGGGVKVWNGSTWVGDIRVWDGAAWVPGKVSVWDGSRWKATN